MSKHTQFAEIPARVDLPMGQFKQHRDYAGNVNIYEHVLCRVTRGHVWRQVALHQTAKAAKVPCGCRLGTCETKPEALCRMTEEIRQGEAL